MAGSQALRPVLDNSHSSGNFESSLRLLSHENLQWAIRWLLVAVRRILGLRSSVYEVLRTTRQLLTGDGGLICRGRYHARRYKWCTPQGQAVRRRTILSVGTLVQ